MMSEQVKKAILPHYLMAGVSMVLVAVVWALGWFIAPENPFADTESPALLRGLNAMVLGAWNLLSCVIAAGFFHAASKYPSDSFRGFRVASLRLLSLGILLLFPVPIMSQVLGASPEGRALALIVACLSFAGIAFGRARIKMIQKRLAVLEEMEDLQQLEPLE